MVAVNASAACAKASEKFFDCACARDFGISESDSSKGVRVAARDADFSVGLCKTLGCRIGLMPHLAVARFERERVGRKPLEVFESAPAGETGENVIHAVEDFALGQVHQKRYKIAATLLNFDVIALRDAVDSEVEFGTARHCAGDLFAQEKVGPASEDFRGVDGIMVGYGDDGHPEALTTVVHGRGVVVGLIAEVPDKRSVDQSGSFGMDVQIASHDGIIAWRYEQSMKSLQIVDKCAHVTY